MAKESYHHGNLKEALIDSGLQILKEEGISALSLRSAARRAGVSHSAPYAHFTSKNALLAAITTQGFLRLHADLEGTAADNQGSAEELLLETAWAYAHFALAEPALFKLMFSGILEDEHAYPEYMAAARSTYQHLVEVVAHCQTAGVLKTGPAEESAIAIWSVVHGFIVLYRERQFPGHLVNKARLKTILKKTLEHLTLQAPGS